jgi:hypothetical protein
MGKLDSALVQPPHLGSGGSERGGGGARAQRRRAVAARVDPFESKGLKPGYHISGSRVEIRRKAKIEKPGYHISGSEG